jgi:hypothetical protein
MRAKPHRRFSDVERWNDEMILQAVIELVSDYTGEVKGGIKPPSRLYHDLNIIGDDADELLEKYSKRFGLDLSQFPADEYFPDEPMASFFDVLACLFRWRSQKNERNENEREFMALTVGDLCLAVKSRVLSPQNKKP